MHSGLFWVWTCCKRKIYHNVLWNWDTVKVTILSALLFFWTTENVHHYFLFVFVTTWQTSRREIILFCDGLNTRGHLPCAIKKALAGAAAFSRTIWIKPKSRRALPIRLAFPSIITANKTWHFINDKHCTSNNLASTSFCSGANAFTVGASSHILRP